MATVKSRVRAKVTPPLKPKSKRGPKASGPQQAEHDFTLILAGLPLESDAVLDALFEAGCDDALFGIQCGQSYAAFGRKAASLKQAVLSAIQDVCRAGVGAEVVRVDYSNLVTLAEIARRTDRSRQVVHQYMLGKRGPGGFPAVAHEIAEGTSVWYWSDVAEWLWRNNMLTETVLREAQAVDAINKTLAMAQLKRHDAKLAGEILAALRLGPKKRLR